MKKKEFICQLKSVSDLETVAKMTKDDSSKIPIREPDDMPRPIHWQTIDDAWKGRLQDKWWATNCTNPEKVKNQDALFQLREKLLSFGGEETCLPDMEEDLEKIMEHGQLWYGDQVILKKGEACHCHRNSAYLWDKNRGKVLIATGYALSQDGMWRQHTWCIQVKPRVNRIVETTTVRTAYFGFAMPYALCENFYFDNE